MTGSTARPDGFRGVFRTDFLARSLYSYGAGIARSVPQAVAVPADAGDLELLIKWATTAGVPLIPRGSGSGMAAGAVGEHLIVDVSRFTRLEDVNVETRSVRAGAGVIRNSIDTAARAVGLRFPVDPSSSPFCTIGGMSATNASGPRSLRFGSTRRWVKALNCVFPDGTRAWIRRTEAPPTQVEAVTRLLAAIDEARRAAPSPRPHGGVRKDSSGYSIGRESDAGSAINESGTLIDLLIGSEGTLAFFTQVELLLEPVPQGNALLLLSFESVEDAAECATHAFSSGASACEMLDRTYLDIAETAAPTGLDPRADAVLIVEFESSNGSEAKEGATRMVGYARRSRALEVSLARGAQEAGRIWNLRHSASPALAALPPTTRSMQFVEDSCVPPEVFADYVRGVRRILKKHDTPGAIFGHAGDAHAHVNPLIDLTRLDWRDTVRSLYRETCELVISLGGTLTGEHGDGRVRAPMLEESWGKSATDRFRALKAAADPHGILNPGCKIPTADADPFAEIRYDPDISPLPPTVQARLTEIERSRRWSSYRLDGF